MPYKNPEDRKQNSRDYYLRNRERILACVKERYDQKRDEISQYKQRYKLTHKAKMRKQLQRHYRENVERIRVEHRAYYQAHREEARQRRQEYYRKNKVHLLAQQRAYAQAHSEQVRERLRIYWLTHRDKRQASRRLRRARLMGAALGPIDYGAIRLRDGMRCWICKRPVLEGELSFDHMIPLAQGGSHSQANLRVAHLRCNVRRGVGRIPVQLPLDTFLEL